MPPTNRWAALAALLPVVCCLAACAPALDWRDTRPEGTAVQLQFPCKPSTQRRDVPLAGERVNLALHACAAGDRTWGLAVADVGDATKVGPALAELAAAAANNLGAAAAPGQPLTVRGATPRAESTRTRLQGRLPDGRQVQMEVAVFAHGTQVFQATVLGDVVDASAATTFFDSMRLGS